jgi:hypothetical protein
VAINQNFHRLETNPKPYNQIYNNFWGLELLAHFWVLKSVSRVFIVSRVEDK